ncbi:MAG: M60 family metallopeptidase [Myxococcota bacterium]|nr:M60 family metallopeptidase [Myxococcota bacterium]
MARSSLLALVSLALSIPSQAQSVQWPASVAEDHRALSENVGAIVHGDAAPGELVLFGDASFPVVVDPEGKPFVAASRLEQGRVAAFSHTLYFGDTDLEAASGQGRLLFNALRWAAASENPVVAVTPGLPALEAFLDRQGWTYRVVNSPAELGNADVFCADANTGWSRPDLNAARRWVEEGRGLLTAGTPWAYDVDRHATELAGNRLLSGSGLVFAEGYTWPNTDDIRVSVESPSPLQTASLALTAMVSHVQERVEMTLDEQRLAARSLSSAIRWLPWRFEFFDEADALRASSGDAFVISPNNPLRKEQQPVRRVLAELEMKLAEERPATQVTASPSAAIFPGSVAENAVRLTEVISMNLSNDPAMDHRRLYAGARAKVMKSTGFYAIPGVVFRVDLPNALLGRGIEVLVGAHTDDVSGRDAWERYPRITRREEIIASNQRIASAFGGLIYVTVPAGMDAGQVEVSFTDVVAAPRFVLGVTTPSEWEISRQAPGPWGEIESEHFVLTAESVHLRDLTNPEEVAAFWDEVLEADAVLAAMTARRRKERMVADQQISLGYLHSGYPFMGQRHHDDEALDVATLRSDGNWGMFHELGHNHQWADWMIPYSTEVTCNLWSVYVMEVVVGRASGNTHPAITSQAREERFDAYMRDGADYSQWDPWIGLEFFLQLQESFGWQLYQDVFAVYRDLPDEDRPTSDQERIDRLVLTLSEKSGVNLCPFVTAWGLPMSDHVCPEMGDRPHWLEDPTQAFTNRCGDGRPWAPEACDDGNDLAGDGCDSACEIETGWRCTWEAPSACQRIPSEPISPGNDDLNPEESVSSGCGCTTMNSVNFMVYGIFVFMLRRRRKGLSNRRVERVGRA